MFTSPTVKPDTDILLLTMLNVFPSTVVSSPVRVKESPFFVNLRPTALRFEISKS